MWFSSPFLLVTTSLTSSSLGEILDVGPGRRCYCVTGARWAQKVRQFYWMWASTMSHWSFWISDLEAPWRCYRTDHEYSGPRPWHIQPWIQIIFQTCGRRLGAEYPDTALYYPATWRRHRERLHVWVYRRHVGKIFCCQGIHLPAQQLHTPPKYSLLDLLLSWSDIWICSRSKWSERIMDALPSPFISLILETDGNLGVT